MYLRIYHDYVVYAHMKAILIYQRQLQFTIGKKNLPKVKYSPIVNIYEWHFDLSVIYLQIYERQYGLRFLSNKFNFPGVSKDLAYFVDLLHFTRELGT